MKNILQFLSTATNATVKEICETLQISRQYAHRKLKAYIEEGKVQKLGSPPKVYYQLAQLEEVITKTNIPATEQDFLQEHFIQVTALGEQLEGVAAMEYWCNRQKLPLEKTVQEYILTRNKYLNYYNKDKLIDGTQKLEGTKGINKVYVDKLYYLDFYAIERFGKTRLGTLMHFAKQGQNKNLMADIVREIKRRLDQFITQEKFDAVLYVPPTIKRETQIMKYLEMHLKLNLPKVEIRKVHNKIVIPQKALSKIFERVANANMSFVNIEKQQFKKVLILDDAVGSGATINEIAAKLRKKNTAQKIMGLAITGSYKGFEVITEL